MTHSTRALPLLPPSSGAVGWRRLPILFATAGALALAACAGLPQLPPARQALAPASLQSAQTFNTPQAEWPADGWWHAYGDPQLDALVAEALAGSPTLAQAEARVRKAEAVAGQARAAGLPSLTLNGSAAEAKQSYNNGIPAEFVPHGYNDIGSLSLNFDWEIDFWGKNRAAVAAATSDTRAAAAEAAETRLVLSVSVASAYADLSRLYAQRDVAARAVAVREELLDLVDKRVNNGLDGQAELKQAASGPPAARADLAAVDEAIGLSRNQLAALVGAGPDRGLAIARPTLGGLKPFGLPANLNADLVGRRPDIAAARWRAEAAASRVKESKAAFYPNINLAGVIGYQSLYLDKLFSSGSDFGQIGPAISLPIFEGGRLRAGLRGAAADRDGAVAAYDETLTQALHDVADVVVSQRALAVRLGESRAALAANQDALRIATLRYKGGLATYQTVLTAETTLLAQQRTVTDLENRAIVLDVALVRALGGGFTSG